jgi:hypothetical protein
MMEDVLPYILNIGRRVKRQSIDRNLYLSKYYYYIRFRILNIRRKDPLIVYQMGKVGSSTIKESLRKLNLSMQIYHVHYLTKENIDNILKYFIEAKRVPTSQIWEGQYLRSKINRDLNGKKWKIVTLVREPIARNISAFFQNIHRWFPDFDSQCKMQSLNVEDLIDCFLKDFSHEEPLVWFDSEMKKVFNVDVFANDFPKSKGYQIYHGKNSDILLLKMENLNKCSQEAFQNFLNVENFRIINANVSDEKEYFLIYKKFINSIILPNSYINRMYASKLMRHFYSDEEINTFETKWRK